MRYEISTLELVARQIKKIIIALRVQCKGAKRRPQENSLTEDLKLRRDAQGTKRGETIGRDTRVPDELSFDR